MHVLRQHAPETFRTAENCLTGLLCHGTLAHPTEDMTRYATPVSGTRGEVVVSVSIEEEPHLTGIVAGAVFPVHAATVAGTVFLDSW